MPLILPRSVCLMIPRAASTWVRQAIRNGGIPYRETNPKHSPEVLPQNPALAHVPSFQFTFTREPEPWLKSRWSLGRWEDDLSPYWDIDYAKFRAAVSDPMIDMYFKKYTSRCRFVGRCETVADDLVKVLREAGEDFDEVSLRRTQKVNESPDGELIGSAYWAMKLDELNRLPDDMKAKLPPQLLDRLYGITATDPRQALPTEELAKLPADVLAKMLARSMRDAVEAGGAGLTRR